MPPCQFAEQKQEPAKTVGFNVVSNETGARPVSDPTRYFVSLIYSSQNTLLYPSEYVAISARNNIRSTQYHPPTPLAGGGLIRAAAKT